MIAGPTAAGKTDMAIEVAKHYGTVIVSCDSRQFYRGMDIGTAKPTAAQQREVRHYMIDNKNVDELYGAGHFASEAVQLLDELFKKHDVVVMTGGSGLYIEAVLYGVDEFGQVPPAIREQISAEYAAKGMEWLRDEVKKHDPYYFSVADNNNPQRLMRALEVSVHSGKPYSGFLKKNTAERSFKAIKILINPGREELYARINHRCDEMMAAGFLEEVRGLSGQKNLNALKTVGYRELFEHLEGRIGLEEAVSMIKQRTRNYAKRQMTWFRNRDKFKAFHPSQKEELIRFIAEEIKIGNETR